MAFFRAFNCRIFYGLYLPTVILTVIWYLVFHHPLTLSFQAENLPSLQIIPTVALPFFLLKYLLHGFPGLFTVISGHISGQSMLDCCFDVSRDLQLTFNCTKSCCFAIGKGSRLRISNMDLGPNSIQWCDAFKYLGVTFHA